MMLRIESMPCGRGVFNHRSLKAALMVHKTTARVFIRKSSGWEPVAGAPTWSENSQFRLEVNSRSSRVSSGTIGHVGFGRSTSRQATLSSALLNSTMSNKG